MNNETDKMICIDKKVYADIEVKLKALWGLEKISQKQVFNFLVKCCAKNALAV